MIRADNEKFVPFLVLPMIYCLKKDRLICLVVPMSMFKIRVEKWQ